jgi:hypothetical protein
VAIVSFTEAGANTSVTIASDLVRPKYTFFEISESLLSAGIYFYSTIK